ncbi:MAG: hypothetical protein NTV56_23100 [Alphaproteobacteria bacterium]|nr:hypothetical protein [Alphaproteobacteria bacterium]
MKAIAFLAATAAILSLQISAASSQGACGKEYQACMDTCATRSAKSMQDRCFQSCEGQNNVCAERVYGKRPFNGAPSNVAAPKAQAKDAMAKEPVVAAERAAPAPEPVAAEPAPQTAAPAKR